MSTIQQRTMGTNTVGAIGLGCMGMSHAYGAANEQENLEVLQTALTLGCNFWDTADFYGAGENEKLLAKVLRDSREQVFLCTKVGNVFDNSLTLHQEQVQQQAGWIVDGTPDYIRQCLDNSLRRLGVDYIDLYYLHRVDPLVPIEESFGAMAELVKQGKVRYLGLSEAAAATIQRAAAVHPVTALQSEYSLWVREIEDEILPLCQQLQISVIPFSPLGRGYLTGTITSAASLASDDVRRQFPRFQADNIAKNKAIITTLETIATAHQAAPAQIALAWLLAQDKHIIPIPGTRHVRYLQENVDAAQISLSTEELSALDAYKTGVAGKRFPAYLEKLVDQSHSSEPE